VCRPWIARNKSAVPKSGLQDQHARPHHHPAGEVERIEFGSVTEFDPDACDQLQAALAV
jgi:hypothetical protein